MGSYPPHYAYPSAPAVVRVVPNPPRLHWAWVLVLSIVTLNLFSCVWLIVQSHWMGKVRGKSKAMKWAIAQVCIFGIFFIFALGVGFAEAAMHLGNMDGMMTAATFGFRVVLFITWMVAIYTLREELSAEPVDIPLSGGLTFLLGPIYFQYHLYNYEVPEAVHMARGPLRTELPPGRDGS